MRFQILFVMWRVLFVVLFQIEGQNDLRQIDISFQYSDHFYLFAEVAFVRRFCDTSKCSFNVELIIRIRRHSSLFHTGCEILRPCARVASYAAPVQNARGRSACDASSVKRAQTIVKR